MADSASLIDRKCMLMSEKLSSNIDNYSILLVNYKTLEITKLCLDLIRQNLDLSKVQVWVVDNNSADESTTYLRALDWINLIERVPEQVENGFTSHGRALDLALDKITTDYVFLFHSDTLLYDAAILEMMLEKCSSDPSVAAVGCYEQVYRGRLKTTWRVFIRFIKHIYRKAKVLLGLNTRPPRGYYEVYLKSFCALWNVKMMKNLNMRFFMGDRIPGYELQDKMRALGYKIVDIPAKIVFQYLEHVEAGTVSVKSGYSDAHRRIKRKKSILKQFKIK